MTEIVFLVKFDCGYYAAKQPNYDWSFTDDPFLAQSYKTLKKAEERGKWGVGIGMNGNGPKTYIIEKYEVVTTMKLVK